MFGHTHQVLGHTHQGLGHAWRRVEGGGWEAAGGRLALSTNLMPAGELMEQPTYGLCRVEARSREIHLEAGVRVRVRATLRGQHVAPAGHVGGEGEGEGGGRV